MNLMLPYIIHPSQGGFIQQRFISVNIVLAADLLEDFNRNAKEKFLCAKFDISKAFDTVSREFILQHLYDKRFPDKFIDWIKACIMDVHFSICINGALEGYFNSSSGLR
ncbi:uncharacterized protein LOC110103034 [Dendrobium catenatum]|uniref:uncharacterized protein LOC110103034 n=1 Tax=Dendrobium catenatum TaxID=906689 RepID=UPI0009F658B6|nr:uncharacterized protein LOC110103034 [Dendrobium catenatum]